MSRFAANARAQDPLPDVSEPFPDVTEPFPDVSKPFPDVPVSFNVWRRFGNVWGRFGNIWNRGWGTTGSRFAVASKTTVCGPTSATFCSNIFPPLVCHGGGQEKWETQARFADESARIQGVHEGRCMRAPNVPKSTPYANMCENLCVRKHKISLVTRRFSHLFACGVDGGLFGARVHLPSCQPGAFGVGKMGCKERRRLCQEDQGNRKTVDPRCAFDSKCFHLALLCSGSGWNRMFA